jgi:hypothetical protein
MRIGVPIHGGITQLSRFYLLNSELLSQGRGFTLVLNTPFFRRRTIALILSSRQSGCICLWNLATTQNARPYPGLKNRCENRKYNTPMAAESAFRESVENEPACRRLSFGVSRASSVRRRRRVNCGKNFKSAEKSSYTPRAETHWRLTGSSQKEAWLEALLDLTI